MKDEWWRTGAAAFVVLLAVSGCASQAAVSRASSEVDNAVVARGLVSVSKPMYSSKADMSTYESDRDYCLRWGFWDWGFSRGQNYRFCMERRGYVVTTTKPVSPVGAE